VVRIFQEFFGNGPHQSIFHCANGLSGRNTRAVTDPKNVGIDCHGEFTKGGIENHIGRRGLHVVVGPVLHGAQAVVRKLPSHCRLWCCKGRLF
jgi:hypothetical protein